MRPLLIAGNWKMNLNGEAAEQLAADLARHFTTPVPDVEIAVCPPAVYLDTVAQALSGSAVQLGAQNMYHESNGAFTGEVSAAMLLDMGCKYVILGHSERRALMGETNDQVNAKTVSALAAGLTPIVCLGESLEQREAGQTAEVVSEQFRGSLAGLEAGQIAQIVIAYEPVWAIGTGKVATPDQAEEVHADLRKLLENQYNLEVANQVKILYGGSVKPDNAAELMGMSNVDGALVGGASLKADSFGGIIQAAQEITAAN